MTIIYTNENTISSLDKAERKELHERVLDAVKNWRGEGLDLENFRYVDQIRYKNMTFSLEISGEDNFLFEQDGEEWIFTDISKDSEIEVKRIG